MRHNITVALEVTMPDEEVRIIQDAVSGDAPMPVKLARVAGGLLRDLAQGGMMLAPESTARIKQAISSLDGDQIVERVESSVNRQAESYRFHYVIDPTLEQPLREMCEVQSRPFDALLQEFVDTWLPQTFFQMNEAPPPLYLDRDQYEWLRRLMGKETLFGSDVYEWVRQRAAARAEAKEVALAD